MKKILLITMMIISWFYVKCQTEEDDKNNVDSIGINLLNAPSNPAFNLMGISPSSIDRPTDLSAFRLSLQNATNSFTKLPTNYAVEISPAAMFDKNSRTLKKLTEGGLKNTFWQSLSVSIGITQSDKEDKETNDENSFTKIGFGLKFSLVRPGMVRALDSFYLLASQTLDEYEKKKQKYFASNSRLKEIETLMQTAPASDIAALNAERTQIRESLFKKIAEDSTDILKTASNKLKEYTVDRLKFDRHGGFLDFASGVALDFPDNRFDNSSVSKAGAWLTGGYDDTRKGISIAGIGRWLFQPDKIFADDRGTLKSKNIHTLDGGVKLTVTALKGKFNFSSEYIYRSVLTKNVIPSSWRLVFNTEYDVGFNQKLTLAIGRNFDGAISKSGNIIAALNFIKGFGSTKKLPSINPNR